MTEAMDVAAAANPTNEWNPATIWGSSVILIDFAIHAPRAAPTPIKPHTWPSTAAAAPSIVARVAEIPPATPTKPRAVPVLAVAC